ncbi:hypothetical protein C8R45DRAFT_939599 [Mycena sanguinolenta]|nr:hypothetical protein C8R45DRAFT_939599 [Mycena sanguinolenta]
MSYTVLYYAGKHGMHYVLLSLVWCGVTLPTLPRLGTPCDNPPTSEGLDSEFFAHVVVDRAVNMLMRQRSHEAVCSLSFEDPLSPISTYRSWSNQPSGEDATVAESKNEAWSHESLPSEAHERRKSPVNPKRSRGELIGEKRKTQRRQQCGKKHWGDIVTYIARGLDKPKASCKRSQGLHLYAEDTRIQEKDAEGAEH